MRNVSWPCNVARMTRKTVPELNDKNRISPKSNFPFHFVNHCVILCVYPLSSHSMYTICMITEDRFLCIIYI